MSNPKANKRVPDSNASFLGSDKNTKEPASSIHYEYRFEERETNALEVIYDYLFNKLTGTNQDK